MEQPDLQTWIIFFVIALGALLWAVFLSAQGDMLWVSLILVIVVLGVTFFKIFKQISCQCIKKERPKRVSLTIPAIERIKRCQILVLITEKSSFLPMHQKRRPKKVTDDLRRLNESSDANSGLITEKPVNDRCLKFSLC